ncbi:MAG TPA: OmpA family protein [Burkholderiaceae bacterium]|nr:OmpA family protein [Burkholderiaceae bacterium]
MGRTRWIAVGLGVAALAGGCATRQGGVVLLPERDGRATAVVVAQGERQLVLDKAYAGAELTTTGPAARAWTPQEVAGTFGGALAAQPAPPAQFSLFFVEGKDEFTEESKRVIDGIFAEIARRPVPDVLVIGHTDTVGSDSFNDALSRQRAEVVRTALLARGIAADKVTAIGRGKREPLVPTGDNVAEPRNRRVEIQVR